MPESHAADPSEELRQFYPGYSGYEEKRLRGFTDSTVRSELSAILKAGQKELNKLTLDLIRLQRQRDVMTLSELCQRLDRVCNHLRFEFQNGRGFFQPEKLPDGLAQKLESHDLTLARICQSASKSIFLPIEGGSLVDQSRQIDGEVQEIERVLDERHELIAGVSESD